MPIDMAEAFAEARRQGWSNLEFARRLGVHDSTLYRLRSGKRRGFPDLRFRERIRKAFPDRNPEDLYRIVEEDPHEPHLPRPTST